MHEVTAVRYIRGKYPQMASRTAAAEAAEQALVARAAAEKAAAAQAVTEDHAAQTPPSSYVQAVFIGRNSSASKSMSAPEEIAIEAPRIISNKKLYGVKIQV